LRSHGYWNQSEKTERLKGFARLSKNLLSARLNRVGRGVAVVAVLKKRLARRSALITSQKVIASIVAQIHFEL
jgi:hypothetical protein